MPRNRTKYKKVQKIEDDDGWTHVLRGPRLPSSELGCNAIGNIGDKLSQIKAGSTLSLAQLRTKYAKSQQYWEEDPLRYRFEQLFNNQVVKVLPDIVIDNVLVLGLGALATDNMDSSSIHQLVLFEYWIKFLRTKYAIPNVYFQDPRFCSKDRMFLEELRYSVIDDPEAYLLLTPTTLLFAPYLPWEITHTFLYVTSPALFIGNDFSSQDSLGLFRERQIVLQSPVIKKYYSCCKKVSLDCRGEQEALDGPKHAKWLADMFMYWSSGNRPQGCNSVDSQSNLFRGALEDQYKPEPPVPQQENKSTEEFRFRAGPGEWRSDGYVFDPRLWTEIQNVQHQRVSQHE